MKRNFSRRKRNFSKTSKKLRKFSKASKKLRKRKFSRASKNLRFKKLRKFGLPTTYQNTVNDLTGALGPTDSAFWPSGRTENPWSLGNQPLYIDPATGTYVNSPDLNASESAVFNP